MSRYLSAIVVAVVFALTSGAARQASAGNVSTLEFVENANSPGFAYIMREGVSGANQGNIATFSSASESIEFNAPAPFNLATQDSFDTIITLTEPGDPSAISDQIVLFGTAARANGHGEISFQSDDGPGTAFRMPGDGESGNHFITLGEDQFTNVPSVGLTDVVYHYTNPFSVTIGVTSVEESPTAPEPSALILGLAGLAGLGFAALRKKYRRA